MKIQFLDRAAAASARAERLTAHRHRGGQRPTARRTFENPRSDATVAVSVAGAQLRDSDAGDGSLVFEGMASVYEPVDHGADGHVCRGYEMYDMFGPYTEYVHLGSGTASLSRGDLDVPLVLAHDSMQRIARTGNAESPLMLREITDGDAPGLHVLAPSLRMDNHYVARIAPLLRSGLIDEMSFRFMITSGRWSEDWSEYHIHAYDIHRGDVAIVGYGANPHTSGSGLRTQPVVSEHAKALLAFALAE